MRNPPNQLRRLKMETNRVEISLEMLVGWPTWAIMVEADVGPEDGTPEPIDMTETTPIPRQPMRELVFGMALAAVMASAAGCATAPRPVEVETVGALSASATHVYVQPVHADTVLTSSFGAVDTDEDAPVVAAAPAAVETPDVAPKAGLTMGVAR